jgi:hypothetical protein
MKWPSIPQPQTDGASLQNSLLAIKENVELMQGVRGKAPFILASDMQSYDDQLAKMSARVKANEDRLSNTLPWKKIYNAYLPSVNNVPITGLAGARYVRFSINAVPASGTDQAIFMYLSDNNGTSWNSAASSYGQAMDYSGGAVGGPGTSTPGSAPSYPAAGTGWTISCHSAMRPTSVSLYGIRVDGMLTGMNQSYTVLNAVATGYRGSGYNDILIGQMAGWKGSFAANAFLIQVGSGLMSIDMIVEALF